MDKELEKELEELAREALKPENRHKLLLAILLCVNMTSAKTTHHGMKLDAIRGRLDSFGDPLFDDYVKDMIERNEAKLKSVGQIVNLNYSSVNEKSPY